MAHPRAALPSAPSFLAGLAALPPGWQQAFPTASRSWAAGAGCYCCLLIRGPRWETRRHTAMPSTLGAQQRTEHHHLLHRRVLWPECTLEGKKPVGAGIFCTPACCANPECKCCYRCCVCWCFLPRRSLQKHFIIMSMGHSPFHRYSRSSFFFFRYKQTKLPPASATLHKGSPVPFQFDNSWLIVGLKKPPKLYPNCPPEPCM